MSTFQITIPEEYETRLFVAYKELYYNEEKHGVLNTQLKRAQFVLGCIRDSVRHAVWRYEIIVAKKDAGNAVENIEVNTNIP